MLRKEVSFEGDAGGKVLLCCLQSKSVAKTQEIRKMSKVISVKHVGHEPVYNLEVEDTHCFAINEGFIVHNCEAFRYGLMSRPSPVSAGIKESKARILRFDPLSEPKDRVIQGGYFGL